MTKKKTALSILLLLSLVLAAPLAWAAQFSGDMKVVMGDRTQVSKIFVDGTKMRTEVQAPNGKMVIIMDTKNDKIMFLMPAQKMYMDGSGMGESMGAKEMPKLGEVPKDAKKVGTEKLKGYSCEVYELERAGMGKSKFWWVKKLGMPIKSVSETPMGKAVTEMENIKEGSQPAELFKVPAGYSKMEMPKMPKMPKGAN